MTKVTLNPILPEHDKILFNWRNDYRIYSWCRQNDLLDWNNHLDWFDNLGNDKTIKMYSIYIGKIIVGVCGFTDINLINQRAEFSLYIGPEFRFKGYAKEALNCLLFEGFSKYPFQTIWGESFDKNPAIKIFTNLGFKQDGIRRDFYFRNGRFIDAHLFSIKRSEYYDRSIASDNCITIRS